MKLKTDKNFSIENAISKQRVAKNFLKKKYDQFDKILNLINYKKNESKNFYNLFNKNFLKNFDFKKLNKYKSFKSIIIIGMGGSTLGLQAMCSFLQHKFKKEIIFLDNLDLNLNRKLLKNKKIKNSLFIFISKSGSTIETLTNINFLNKIKFSKKNTIVITEKRDNPLYDFCIKNKLMLIEHKRYIGGRYSILSEVGLVPAYIIGLNIKNFRKNINKYLLSKNKITFYKNLIETSKIYSNKKIKSMIFMNYTPELDSTVFWCQQLISESLGKNGIGVLPVLSKGPKDHHSLLQLYLDGPKDKVFYIFSSLEKEKTNIKKNFFSKKLKFLNNKKMVQIKNAQREAFVKILAKKKIPYKTIRINKISEEGLGDVFSFFMLETVILGLSMKINPFDQPAVEEVKILTKKTLI